MYEESLVPLLIRLAIPSNFWGKKITKRFLKRLRAVKNKHN